MKRWANAIWVLLSFFISGYSSAVIFEMDAQLGGGGGYTFTGSQTSHWMSCKTCHQTTRPDIPVSIKSTPPGLIENGYEPNTQYLLEVSLVEEQLGMEFNGGCIEEDTPCNRNGMAIEFLVAGDKQAGILCPTAEDLVDGQCNVSTGKGGSLIREGAAIIGQTLEFPSICSPSNTDPDCLDVGKLSDEGKTQDEIEATISSMVRGKTNWNIVWQAPAAGTGFVGLFMGVVDGNGGRTYDPYYSDYVDDDVAIIRHELEEIGALNPGVPWVEDFAGAKLTADGSCGALKSRPPHDALILVILLCLGIVLRRKKCSES